MKGDRLMNRAVLILADLSLLSRGAGRAILIRAFLCSCVALGVHTSTARAGFVINTPSGLTPGDTFFVVFLDSTTHPATSTNIDDYNKFIHDDAAGITCPGGTIGAWQVIGATNANNAASPLFTNTTAPVYDLLGTNLAPSGVDYLATGYAPHVDQNGLQPVLGDVWTGLNGNKVATFNGNSLALGSTFAVAFGLAGDRMSNGGLLYAELSGTSESHLLYGYALLTVGPTTSAVPEPSTLTLLGIGSLGLLGYGWRRRKQAVALLSLPILTWHRIPSTTKRDEQMKRAILMLAALALLLGGVGQARADMFHFTGTIQTFTVPTTGLYDINVAGAQGGSDRLTAAGKGVVLSGTISLTAGEVLQIVMGGQANNPTSGGGGGGGGGSFVYVLGAVQPIMVAGGGGGGGSFEGGGGDGQTGTAGQSGFNTLGGAGGTNGTGGGGGTSRFFGGGGGAGWLGDGGNSTSALYSGGGGFGPTASTAFAGGAGIGDGNNGGFGGGGGGAGGGGGGGGYSGGGGGDGTANYFGGGGGGSFHDASLVTLFSATATQTGNGFVDIEPAVSGVPEPSTLTLLGLGSLGLLGYGWRRRKRAAA
jgi:hypothetical protein